MNVPLLLSAECLITTEFLDGLWFKRIESLRQAYKDMESEGIDGVDFGNLSLSPHLSGRVVDHYIGDYQILRLRYGISDSIQLHRVAGLFAASICRFRPIVIQCEKPSADEAGINEHFALQVGLSICAECHAREGDDISAILQGKMVAGWAKRMKMLLNTRNYTAESLAMVFETFCALKFPKNFTSDPVYA